jgi:hypothetical protein
MARALKVSQSLSSTFALYASRVRACPPGISTRWALAASALMGRRNRDTTPITLALSATPIASVQWASRASGR